MIHNESNIVEELKFKARTKNKIMMFSVFLVWIIAYTLILRIEATAGDAYGFFALGLCFAVISLASMILVPAHREDSLRLFKFGLIGYSLYTIMFELVFYATTLGDSSGTQTVLRNFCLYGRIMIPIGLIIWQAKEIFMFFKGHRTKEQEIDNLKEHGNDGFH